MCVCRCLFGVCCRCACLSFDCVLFDCVEGSFVVVVCLRVVVSVISLFVG